MTMKDRGRGAAGKGRLQALAALYAELPAMACQGLCADSCYSLVQTELERTFVRDRTGVELDLVQAPPTACPALTMLNQCGVYKARPMICRAPFQVDPERAEQMMMALQRERDLEYERRVSGAKNPVFVVSRGRFSKERPRRGRW